MEELIIINTGNKYFYLLCAYVCIVVAAYYGAAVVLLQAKLKKLIRLRDVLLEGSSYGYRKNKED